MGASGGGSAVKYVEVPVYQSTGKVATGANASSSATAVQSAVARDISTQTQATSANQTAARQRGHSIASTYLRGLTSDTGAGKSKLGQ